MLPIVQFHPDFQEFFYGFKTSRNFVSPYRTELVLVLFSQPVPEKKYLLNTSFSLYGNIYGTINGLLTNKVECQAYGNENITDSFF